MGLSDLKKRLPEAAFGKRNYVESEGGCDEYSASRADGHGVVPGQGEGRRSWGTPQRHSMKVPWSHILVRQPGEGEEILEQKNIAVKFRGVRGIR